MWHTMEYYSTIKKEWNNAICSNMDGPRDYHTKWSKSDRERHMISLIDGTWKQKHSGTYFTKQKWIHRHREATWGCQGGKQGRHEVWVWD